MSDSYWNYRVMRHSTPLPEMIAKIEGREHDVWYAIHEVHYGSGGQVLGWSVEPITPFGTSPEELQRDFTVMMSAFERGGVLDYDAPPEEEYHPLDTD